MSNILSFLTSFNVVTLDHGIRAYKLQQTKMSHVQCQYVSVQRCHFYFCRISYFLEILI